MSRRVAICCACFACFFVSVVALCSSRNQLFTGQPQIDRILQPNFTQGLDVKHAVFTVFRKTYYGWNIEGEIEVILYENSDGEPVGGKWRSLGKKSQPEILPDLPAWSSLREYVNSYVASVLGARGYKTHRPLAWWHHQDGRVSVDLMPLNHMTIVLQFPPRSDGIWREDSWRSGRGNNDRGKIILQKDKDK